MTWRFIVIAQVNPLDQGIWQVVLGGGGALATLVLFLYGFHAEWWVGGKSYRRRLEELDEKQKEVDRLLVEVAKAQRNAWQHGDTVRREKDAELTNLRIKIEDQIIPLVVRSTDLLARLMGNRQHDHDA